MNFNIDRSKFEDKPDIDFQKLYDAHGWIVTTANWEKYVMGHCDLFHHKADNCSIFYVCKPINDIKSEIKAAFIIYKDDIVCLNNGVDEFETIKKEFFNEILKEL